MKEGFLRPIKRFVLILDDQPEHVDGGIVLTSKAEACYHMDFTVVAVGTNETVDFGVGDRVVLENANRGRRLMLGGTVYRLVKVTDIIAVMGGAE
jgi:co-chaperonin GroES (HSP10)